MKQTISYQLDKEKNIHIVIAPAGKYYVGCVYEFVSRRKYDFILNNTNSYSLIVNFFHKGYRTSKGVTFTFHCDDGAGIYRDQFGNEYCTDIGELGLISVKHVTRHPKDAIIIDSITPVTCTKQGGMLKFGQYEICTGEEND